ncbi:MAG: phosphate/phosphite/phosphonate ABC transporter substrate-binding protein [Thermostichus sp. DG_1_6_bins_120]
MLASCRVAHWLLKSIAVAGLVVAAAGHHSIQAQPCPRPAGMDERYCDADGDLVADAPTDPAQIVNPSTLLISYTSSEDPAVYSETWQEFTDYLKQVTGKEVQFVPVDSEAAQTEALRAGRLHIMGTCTGCTPRAVNQAGFVPFAIFAKEDGSFGYEMEVITHVESDLQKLEDIKGRRIAFTQPSSNSGYISARILIEAETGLKDGVDYEANFSGGHENSILGVYNGDYDAAPIANDVLNRMCIAGQVQCNQFRTLYKSATFPSGPFGYAHNLDPELQKKIREAFYTFDFTGTKLAEAFDRVAFVPITYKEDWAVIRLIQENAPPQ